MKIHLVIFLVTPIIILPVWSGVVTAKAPSKQDGLYGAVKTVETETERLSEQAGKSFNSRRVRVHNEVYDATGYRTEWKSYQADGSLMNQEIIIKDATGTKILTGASYNPDGTLSSWWVYVYDQDGTRIVGGTGYDANGAPSWRDTYAYDTNGSRVRETRYSSDGSILSEVMYTYDGIGGKTLTGTRFQLDGSVESRWLQRYDFKGNLVEGDSLLANSTPLGRTFFSYDEKGALVDITSYDAVDSLQRKWVYSYDDRGNVNKEEQVTYTSSGTVEVRSVKHFDQEGNPSRIISYDGEGKLIAQIVYAYEIDSVGNWVKKTTFGCTMGPAASDGKRQQPLPCEVTYRTITYY